MPRHQASCFTPGGHRILKSQQFINNISKAWSTQAHAFLIIWGIASADGDGHRHASCYYEHTDAHSIGDYGHDDLGPRCDCHAIPHGQHNGSGNLTAPRL